MSDEPQPQDERNEHQRKLDQLHAAYRQVFRHPKAHLVIDDLAKVCCADNPTFVMEDPGGRLTAHQEGRRFVYLRINKFRKINPEE